jgi:hypothetical protein
MQRALVADEQRGAQSRPASVWHWQRRSGARLHSCRFADRLPLPAANARPKRNGNYSQHGQNDLPTTQSTTSQLRKFPGELA